MLNPAGAKYGLVGVYSTSISELMGDALQKARRPRVSISDASSLSAVIGF